MQISFDSIFFIVFGAISLIAGIKKKFTFLDDYKI